MAEILPFRGVRYDEKRAGALDAVLTQPYDKITPAMWRAYEERSPYSMVRLILGELAGRPSEPDYREEARRFRSWLDAGLLRRDERPAFYVYEQEFRAPGEELLRRRRGVIALGRLHPYGAGEVFPHERTFAGPRADRLRHLRATRCQFGQIFMLFSDPDGRAAALLAEPGAPLANCRDEFGHTHRLWRLDAPGPVAALQAALAQRPLFIADGHHRYETALAYREEARAQGPFGAPPENEDFQLMTLFRLEDPGVVILPTHRVLSGLAPGTPAEFLRRAAPFFEAALLPAQDPGPLLEALRRSGATAIGVAGRGWPQALLLTLRAGRSPEELVPGPRAGAWKRLDVNILHQVLLRRVLGLEEESASWRCEYLREAGEAFARLAAGAADLVCLLRPAAVAQVREVAELGEAMPQKSTDFYPKLLTGMVINLLNDPAPAAGAAARPAKAKGQRKEGH